MLCYFVQDEEKANSVEQSKQEQRSGSGRQKKGPKFNYEFGGPIGVFLMTLGLPAFMLFINFMCDKVTECFFKT